MLTTDPKAKLEELFNFYIKRQFASDREYQEIIMRRSLADFLQKIKLASLYKLDQKIGDDTYNVVVPFVHYEGNTPSKVIKPLHLANRPQLTSTATATPGSRPSAAWVVSSAFRRSSCLPSSSPRATGSMRLPPRISAPSLRTAGPRPFGSPIEKR